MTDAEQSLIDSQRSYYELRAPDFGDAAKPDRLVCGLMEPALVRQVVDEFAPVGDLLELACGEGAFTRELVRHARTLTAVDASPAMLARNRAQMEDAAVRYVQADLFSWQPHESYDVVFFANWLSHVPPARFDDFWQLVRSCLRPGARVAFLDEDERAVTFDDGFVRDGVPAARRTLDDGRVFDIVKVFWGPAELEARLRDLDWHAHVRRVGESFLFGTATARG